MRNELQSFVRSRALSRGLLCVAASGALALAAGCTVTQAGGRPFGIGSSIAATSQPAAPLAPVPYAGLKKRLAVLRLDNKLKTPWPDPSWQIGEGLTEMLTTELFKTGRFVMVERAALADIVKEQEVGQTGLVQRETAAKVGELLGAQLLITGALTEFDAGTSGGGSAINYKGLALRMQGATAHVAVDIRLVDSETGEILRSHNASGTAQETSFGFLSTGRTGAFGSEAFFKTPIGAATREAINKAVGFIVGEMETVPWSGRVVQARGTEVVVNAGANVNLRPGGTLTVYAKGEELRDPATGVKLGSRDTRIGTLTLTQIEDKFSIGTFNGSGSVKRGDLLKP